MNELFAKLSGECHTKLKEVYHLPRRSGYK